MCNINESLKHIKAMAAGCHDHDFIYNEVVNITEEFKNMIQSAHTVYKDNPVALEVIDYILAYCEK